MVVWPTPTKRAFPATEAPSFLRCDLRLDATNPEQCCAHKDTEPSWAHTLVQQRTTRFARVGCLKKAGLPLQLARTMAQNVLNNVFLYAGSPRGGCMAV